MSEPSSKAVDYGYGPMLRFTQAANVLMGIKFASTGVKTFGAVAQYIYKTSGAGVKMAAAKDKSTLMHLGKGAEDALKSSLPPVHLRAREAVFGFASEYDPKGYFFASKDGKIISWGDGTLSASSTAQIKLRYEVKKYSLKFGGDKKGKDKGAEPAEPSAEYTLDFVALENPSMELVAAKSGSGTTLSITGDFETGKDDNEIGSEWWAFKIGWEERFNITQTSMSETITIKVYANGRIEYSGNFKSACKYYDVSQFESDGEAVANAQRNLKIAEAFSEEKGYPVNEAPELLTERDRSLVQPVQTFEMETYDDGARPGNAGKAQRLQDEYEQLYVVDEESRLLPYQNFTVL
ncbi:hypothetical protein [Kitasatospora mediocidica]|uniref:hypothetical protein n=1 Tax=Kitasatospora mediocidica TaxID=58352 RepID=UPI00056BD0C9|nr:hypothetical protein [Kitasatospora mediocidica]